MSDDGTAGAIEANEALRVEAASAMRELQHAFIGHDVADEALVELRDFALRHVDELDHRPPRSRSLMLERARAANPGSTWEPSASAGFEDRAVGGRANPGAVVLDMRREGDVMVADVTLGPACEGAPGRAHGGVVAAVFDDFTGAVIGMLREPAFTGELTVRYVQPVPVLVPLELRTWLESRDGRKLYIHAEARAGDELVATCRAIYIAVDPARFAAAGDPR